MNLQKGFSKGFIGITLITLSIVLICLLLGFWQIQRLHWKEGLLSSLTESNLSSFEPIETVIAHYKNTVAPNLTKVRLKGVYRHDLEIKLIPRTLKGTSGAHLLTPFVFSSGKFVLINRGWIPDSQKQTIHIKRPQGELEVFGYVRHPTAASKISPKNDVLKGTWFNVNVMEISKFLSSNDKTLIQKMLPFYVMQKPDKTYEGYPVPLDLLSSLPNHHLQYAFTWFFLAFGLLLGYIG
ncbi:MAG: hypothetical protein IBJ00_05980, partial [Alphaproteobacteria bacterium]|nr:hypothetical protein [Alphaproteobacteria bacterium]